MNLCCLVVVMQINNAGSNAYSYKPLAESSDEDLLWELLLLIHEFVVLHLVGVNIITVLCREVVSTNTLGLMLCCREVKGLFSCLLFKHYAGMASVRLIVCILSTNRQLRWCQTSLAGAIFSIWTVQAQMEDQLPGAVTYSIY